LNTAAQVVEMVHCVEDGIEIIDELLERGVEPEGPVAADVKAGEGVGSCDVPRGILFHHYAYDEEGFCEGANCIIPTNQNLANLNHDMQELLPRIIDKPQDEVRLTLEMLVRAYDPCISCSAHFLTVEFV
jgi:coenzyme F420-reducing hydrogenase alpha subunit